MNGEPEVESVAAVAGWASPHEVDDGELVALVVVAGGEFVAAAAIAGGGDRGLGLAAQAR